MNPIPLLWSTPTRLPTLMKNRIPSPAEETAIPYTERELLQRVLQNMARTIKPARDTPRWVLVGELFACGEDVAHRICWRYGFDSDWIVDRVEDSERLPWEDLDDGK